MELEQYLHELNKRKDETLTSELGVYDNYPILVGATFDELLDYFRNSDKWAYAGIETGLEERIKPDGRELLKAIRIAKEERMPIFFNCIFHKPLIQIFAWPTRSCVPDEMINILKRNEFKSTVMFHPYNGRDYKGNEDCIIGGALAIADFSEEFIVGRYSAAYLYSMGKDYIDDFSRIVLYKP